MKNELLTIGPLTVYGYGAMIALGVIAAWVVTELRAKKLRLSSDHVFALVLWGLLGGLLCAKLLYWITEWKSIIADPGFILDMHCGYLFADRRKSMAYRAMGR